MKTINLSYGKTLENKAQVDDNQSQGSQSNDGSVSLSLRALTEVSDEAVLVPKLCGLNMECSVAEPFFFIFCADS